MMCPDFRQQRSNPVSVTKQDRLNDQLEIQTNPFSVQPLTDDFFFFNARPSYHRSCSLSILTMDNNVGYPSSIFLQAREDP